ncbi:MAG: DUF4290 domain-containing protein [Bacteroidales bacterium]|nr:DUF4290 domain-containing protein [Bacteroidales bacterium]
MEYDYNSRRNKLVLPEYGRNIQIMVEHLLSIEDREERNKAAKAVIAVMGNLNPHLRDVSDFKHKLWDHLAIISDFKLDIDSPYETPAIELLNEKPKKIGYNQKKIRYKHYGHSIFLMIQKAVEMEDGEEKRDLIKMIANHMKKSYLTWNREAVDNREIIEDLRTLSNNRLEIDPDMELSETRDILAKNVRKKKGGGKKR